MKPDDPAEEAEALSYSPVSEDTLRQIKIARISLNKAELEKLAALPKETIVADDRWMIEEKPDTMRSSPWNTLFYVFELRWMITRAALITHGLATKSFS
ncbi:MAG TPA: hypothetical protein VGN23_08645 [Verrucomicrobiae bacterium]